MPKDRFVLKHDPEYKWEAYQIQDTHSYETIAKFQLAGHAIWFLNHLNEMNNLVEGRTPE